VSRIQRAEYSQYAWDLLPLDASSEGSILRLDHIFPVGFDPSNWILTEYVMRDEALAILDEWISWQLTGLIPAGGMLEVCRDVLLSDGGGSGIPPVGTPNQ
jgi:hypothetical protein